VLFFVDLEDAYGSVSWNQIDKVLGKLKPWNDDELGLFKFIQTRSDVKLNQAIGRCSKGLMQGSKLSCDLFTIFLGTIMQEVRAKLL
jgi:hypothetical protein